MVSTSPSGETVKALLLVTERHPSIRTLEGYLLNAGCSVEFGGDGLQGLERARALLPDILIAEFLLPRLDGVSVCRSLKAEAQTSWIPILILSVLAAQDRAHEAGADAFLRMPLDAACLIATVRGLLSAGKKRPGRAG